MIHLLVTPSFWSSTVAAAGPIAFTALACLLASRSGSLFVGVEGTLLVSAFAALGGAVATGSLVAGVVAAVVAGALAGLVTGVMSMLLGMGDIVAGLMMQILALGVTGFLQARFAPDGLAVGRHQMGASWRSSGTPMLDVVVHQPLLVYVSVACAPALRSFLRTRSGLRVRAAGESLRVAGVLGVDVRRTRMVVLSVAGGITGLGGALLGLAVVGSFSTEITSGRGFVALACVILASWRPLVTLLAALAFAAVYTFGFQVDQAGPGAYIQLLPYALTLAVIAVFKGKRGPAEEGRGLVLEGRA